MSDFVKGEKPRDLDAAVGGPKLERVRSFLKDEDVGSLGPPNKQNYSSKGSPAKRTGDKSLPVKAPRS
jgi:hypothetical protein